MEAFRALRHRNYRLFFGGQTISLVGSWMTGLATGWLVYRLTGSAVMLGVVTFARQIPTFLIAPMAGVWVDRWNRRRTLIFTQILSTVQSLLIAALTLAGIITLPELIVLSIFQGIVNAFDMPARQSFLVEMVEDRADLANAVAMNSSMVNLARLIGPSLAGVTIAAVGEGICFLIDGISYIAVIGSLIAMRVANTAPSEEGPGLLQRLSEGWSYVAGFSPIRTLLLLFALINFLGAPYTVLLPVLATKLLNGGPEIVGLLMGAAGVGALASALRLALRRSVLGLYAVITSCTVLFGIMLILLGLSHTLWISLLLMAAAGFGMMQATTAISTLVQTIVPDDRRGRVMSYWTMAFMGASPMGGLVAGAMVPLLGEPVTLAVCGVGCLLCAAWFWSRREKIRSLVRPIYQELGILPAPVGGHPSE